MKEAIWGYFIILMGVTAVAFMFFFQNITNTNEHNYFLLKELTEAAMIDAFNKDDYDTSGTVRIDREKFVENFVRRFAENASLSRTYVIEFYDINETPPKVSLKVSSTEKNNVTDEIMSFDISNRLDAILEADCDAIEYTD